MEKPNKIKESCVPVQDRSGLALSAPRVSFAHCFGRSQSKDAALAKNLLLSAASIRTQPRHRRGLSRRPKKTAQPGNSPRHAEKNGNAKAPRAPGSKKHHKDTEDTKKLLRLSQRVVRAAQRVAQSFAFALFVYPWFICSTLAALASWRFPLLSGRYGDS
jgi:hypothetical protein